MPIIICFVKKIIKYFLNFADINNVVVLFVNRAFFQIQMLLSAACAVHTRNMLDKIKIDPDKSQVN